MESPKWRDGLRMPQAGTDWEIGYTTLHSEGFGEMDILSLYTPFLMHSRKLATIKANFGIICSSGSAARGR